MRSSLLRAGILAAAADVAAAATATGTKHSHPCAEVSASWAAQAHAATPTVDASLAHDCLKSVPLGKKEAVELVDSIEPYLEWQSDAAYLKDPPKDYFYPPVDIFGNLAKVRANILADKYDGEYEFQTDLYESVIGGGHDGHYIIYPDLLARAFGWIRQRSLVSISEDGSSLPVIKLYEDIVKDPKTARVVEKINGIKASKYVEDTINKATYNQDVDAAYNSMFYEQTMNSGAGLKGYFAGGGRIGLIYQGANTTFTFEDGDELSLANKAKIVGDFTGVTDGKSFYKKFCTPVDPPSGGDESGGNYTVPGYPKPVISTKDGIVSGYYLEGEGLEDVAVIALLAFESASPAEFQAVTRDFIAEAKAAGKKKLVVDLQGNGGGYILLGYDFFRQLFPHVVEDGYSRWKENKGFMALSHIISDFAKDFDPFNSADTTGIQLYETWFNDKYDLNLTLGAFESFKDKFAPQIYQDTPYTDIMRWNLSDPLTTKNETFGLGIDITGYGDLTNGTQPFKAEDIILLYDGVCASTCTLASEMLRIQGHVKSVAFGGRPKEGPIQGVGGVKGSQILNYADIYTYAQQAANYTKDHKKLETLKRYKELPFQRATAAAVNVRDQILRDNVKDGVPAQFITEEADCRLYYTAEMITDVSKIWEAAAQSAFNGKECAYGGIEASSTKSSGHVSGHVGAPHSRLSAHVDKTPIKTTPEWRALHQLKVIS